MKSFLKTVLVTLQICENKTANLFKKLKSFGKQLFSEKVEH